MLSFKYVTYNEHTDNKELLEYQSSHCLKITQNVAYEFFEFWHFPIIFDLLKLTCLATLFDHKLHVFKNSPK